MSRFVSISDLLGRMHAGAESRNTAGAALSTAAVSAGLRALEATLIPHLDEEEANVVPLAAAHMNAAEWGQLSGHAMGHFQGDKVWLIMGLVRENFTQEQRDMMLAHMPPPAREMWETAGERSFNELIVQVRQTA